MRVVDLEPGSIVRITARRPWGWWRVQVQETTAEFRANENGVVDLSSMASTDAPWEGVDARGLFWSMRSTGVAQPSDWPTSEVRLRASVEGDVVATAKVILLPGTTDQCEVALPQEFPHAFLSLPPVDQRVDPPGGSQSWPVIIALGGSEGGDSAARAFASRFTARGYAVVGYPYYSPAETGQPQALPGLSRAFHATDLSRRAGVRDWIRGRAELDGEKIGLYGISKGAEFVLAAASRIDGFSCVAGIVPSDVIWEGWGPGTASGQASSFAFEGEPLPFVPYEGMVEVLESQGTGQPLPIRGPHDAGREAFPERVGPARIDVARSDE
ncbi:MAG: acyl-CoA thioesterase/BAAT N-terminal domain-containing protein, partial [Myxococcota bacterium]